MRQFGMFALVGVSNTVISFVAYAILIRIGVLYGAAGALAFALGAGNGYILNRRWTFAAQDSMRARLRYLVVQTAGLAATVALLWLFVSYADIGRLAAYPITIPAVPWLRSLPTAAGRSSSESACPNAPTSSK
jgi:putative flippase GtrA